MNKDNIDQKWWIRNGLELLDDLDKNSVTLMVLDLPYFKVISDGWDNQWKTLDDYLDWCKDWFIKCERALKDNGSLYYFNSRFKVIKAVDTLIESCTDLNFRQFITIDKGIESIARRTNINILRSYPNASEYLTFYTFSNIINSEMLNDKITSRNSLAKELIAARLNDGITVNEIAELGGFYGVVNHGGSVTNWERGYNIPSKEQWVILCKYLPSLNPDYEDLRYPFNLQPGYTDVWHFNFYKERRHGHPTQKPTDLIKRIVLTSSNKGDLVCDPAMGTGTTMKVCEMCDRNFVGAEISFEYEQVIKDRCLSHTTRLSDKYV